MPSALLRTQRLLKTDIVKNRFDLLPSELHGLIGSKLTMAEQVCFRASGKSVRYAADTIAACDPFASRALEDAAYMPFARFARDGTSPHTPEIAEAFMSSRFEAVHGAAQRFPADAPGRRRMLLAIEQARGISEVTDPDELSTRVRSKKTAEYTPVERSMLLNHPLLPFDAFLALAGTATDVAEQQAILRHRLCSDFALSEFVDEHMTDNARFTLFSHPNFGPHTFAKLRVYPTEAEGSALLDAPATSAVMLEHLAETLPGHEAQMRIVAHPNAGSKALARIALRERNLSVRDRVLQHRRADESTRLALAQSATDPQERLRLLRASSKLRKEEFEVLRQLAVTARGLNGEETSILEEIVAKTYSFELKMSLYTAAVCRKRRIELGKSPTSMHHVQNNIDRILSTA